MIMSFLEQFGSRWSTIAAIVISAVAVYLTVIALTRLSGVRALAKMSSFDFAATVAVGSTVSSTALGSTPLINGVMALCMLYALQYMVASLRRRDVFKGAVDNEPLLLMRDGQALDDNLQIARVSRTELWAQLRMAGVHRRDEVRAVVMETTGDMSVITRAGPMDAELFACVRGGTDLDLR